MSDKNKQIIAEKISKIIAKAESTNSEAEAEMLMAHAQAMLEQHGLDMLDLGTLDANDPVGAETDAFTFWAAENFAGKLAFELATYYGCKAMYHQRGNGRYVGLAGRESARVTFKLMMPFVMKQIRQRARAMVKRGETKTESRAKTAIGNALMYRLTLLNHAQRQQQQATSSGRALVPVDMVDAAFQQAFPDATELDHRRIKTNYAAAEEAEGISLHRQTGSSEQLKLGK